MRHLVLAGGGHAQLAVLESLGRRKLPGVAVTLVSPTARQAYSGMLPGWIAGHYALDQCAIDLHRLAMATGVRFLEDSVAAIDANRRYLALASGRIVHYDLLSLDVGSETDVSWLESLGERLVAVRPLAVFIERWPSLLAEAIRSPSYRLAVAGGGAAALELALAASFAFARAGAARTVSLVTPADGLLPGFSCRVRSLARKAAIAADLDVHRGPAAGSVHGLLLPDGREIEANHVIAATGAAPPCWLRRSGLALDEWGFMRVDDMHRSVSHPDIFAAGDVCARPGAPLQRSGVHAVRAGPVLAANLRATLAGGPLRRFMPRRRSLYLLGCGPRRAIATWGPLSAEGHWAWRWKDRIDRAFVARHSRPGISQPACPVTT
jgi:pyridine nucleotide-disulfide oxidoreductase family protein